MVSDTPTAITHGPRCVLILVLMEDGLGLQLSALINVHLRVLILVLMEDGLGLSKKLKKSISRRCLNPCFNGRWSRTAIKTEIPSFGMVLILVLMEDGLGPISALMVIEGYRLS